MKLNDIYLGFGFDSQLLHKDYQQGLSTMSEHGVIESLGCLIVSALVVAVAIGFVIARLTM